MGEQTTSWDLEEVGKVGVFDSLERAEACVELLTSLGVARQYITLVSEELHAKQPIPSETLHAPDAFLAAVLGIEADYCDYVDKLTPHHTACHNAVREGKTLVVVQEAEDWDRVRKILQGMKDDAVCPKLLAKHAVTLYEADRA